VGEEAIISFHLKNPMEGDEWLTFIMLDGDVVALSPANVGRALKQAGTETANEKQSIGGKLHYKSRKRIAVDFRLQMARSCGSPAHKQKISGGLDVRWSDQRTAAGKRYTRDSTDGRNSLNLRMQPNAF
jgi:hypothetical protein